MGAFATRTPHRPCPIGLTVAKVEAVQGHTVLVSGVDLVDGTPALDVKPYLPYGDSINGATVPTWVKIATVEEAKRFYPLFRLDANVALTFSGRTVKYFSSLRRSLGPGVDGWALSLKAMMSMRTMVGG